MKRLPGYFAVFVTYCGRWFQRSNADFALAGQHVDLAEHLDADQPTFDDTAEQIQSGAWYRTQIANEVLPDYQDSSVEFGAGE